MGLDAEVRSRCAGQRGAVLEHPFGEDAAVWKVAGKLFAIVGSREGVPVSVTLKCEPELGAALREEHAGIREGYHMDKRHWLTIAFDGSVDEELLLDLVDRSYDLVVAGLPKKTQASLGATPPG